MEEPTTDPRVLGSYLEEDLETQSEPVPDELTVGEDPNPRVTGDGWEERESVVLREREREKEREIEHESEKERELELRPGALEEQQEYERGVSENQQEEFQGKWAEGPIEREGENVYGGGVGGRIPSQEMEEITIEEDQGVEENGGGGESEENDEDFVDEFEENFEDVEEKDRVIPSAAVSRVILFVLVGCMIALIVVFGIWLGELSAKEPVDLSLCVCEDHQEYDGVDERSPEGARRGIEDESVSEEFWEWEVSFHPLFGSYLGEQTGNFPSLEEPLFSSARNLYESLLLKTNNLPFSSSADTLESILEWKLSDLAAGRERVCLDPPSASLSFLSSSCPLSIALSPTSPTSLRFLPFSPSSFVDRESYLSRLDSAPLLLQQTIGLLRSGMKSGNTLPVAATSSITHHLREMAKGGPSHPLLQLGGPALDSQKEEKLIKEKLAPAYGTLLDFWVHEYLPSCRPDLSLSSSPSGKEHYTTLLGHYVGESLAKSPTELLRQGISQMEEVAQKMIAQSPAAAQPSPDAPGEVEDDFVLSLASNPALFSKLQSVLSDTRQLAHKHRFSSLKQALDDARYWQQVIDSHTLQVLPNPIGCPIQIQSIESSSQPFVSYLPSDFLCSRPALIIINANNITHRPRLSLLPHLLSVTPGRHLMSASQIEGAVGPLDVYSTPPALSEGWALYSVRFGGENQLFLGEEGSESEEASFLTTLHLVDAEMVAAIRMVADIGVHYLGWERWRVVELFSRLSLLDGPDIEREVERIGLHPAHSVAQGVGDLFLRIDREKWCGEAPRSRCDLPGFHSFVMKEGVDFLDSFP